MNKSPQPSNRLWAYLEIVRLPNLFTAMADAAMGFLYVQQSADPEQAWEMSWRDAPTLILLLAASTLLYAGGVVLNDAYDADVDRQERPERPIPSGRVSLAAARRLGWVLLIAGAAIPWAVSWQVGQYRPGLIALLLAAAIALYDCGVKRTPLGPLLMGMCRGLNVLLGMSVLGRFAPEHYLIAGGIAVYVAGLTWMARSEARRSQRLQIVAATAVMMAGIALLAWLPSWAANLLEQFDPQRWYIIIGLFGAWIACRCLYAAMQPVAGRVQGAVAHGIMSLVIFDAAVCWTARGPVYAAAIAALLLPAVFFGQYFRST
jgi:4-hydroxybenzoate polyprenyltransferase